VPPSGHFSTTPGASSPIQISPPFSMMETSAEDESLDPAGSRSLCAYLKLPMPLQNTSPNPKYTIDINLLYI
jgi:hypothetical protein